MNDAQRKASCLAFERHFIEMLKLIDSVTLLGYLSIRQFGDLNHLQLFLSTNMLHENDDSDI